MKRLFALKYRSIILRICYMKIFHGYVSTLTLHRTFEQFHVDVSTSIDAQFQVFTLRGRHFERFAFLTQLRSHCHVSGSYPSMHAVRRCPQVMFTTSPAVLLQQ